MAGGWEDYFIRGTKVLKNRLGLTDAETLREAEEKLVYVRIRQLEVEPLDGNFDYAHYKAIHGYLFQDVYEWAGQERTAPQGQFMVKAGHAYYPAGPELTKAAEKLFAGLHKDNLLVGLQREEFLKKLAEFWGELNVVHSFREGNTRTQAIFFREFIAHAGYRLDVQKLYRDADLRARFVAARFHSQDTGDNSRLAAVLGEMIRDR